MRSTPPSPFDTLENCFRLLTTGPAPLAIDGRRLGHGLPTRQIALSELRVLLHHPATTTDACQVALRELARLAVCDRGRWRVGLAGVILPALRRIAASTPPVHQRVTWTIEADLLARARFALRGPQAELFTFATDLLQVACSSQHDSRGPTGRDHRHPT